MVRFTSFIETHFSLNGGLDYIFCLNLGFKSKISTSLMMWGEFVRYVKPEDKYAFHKKVH